MKLSTYTVKKSLGHKTTLKSVTGSYNSDDNNAEVTLTFEGEIDTEAANNQANIEVRKLLNYKDSTDWLNETTSDKEEK